MQAFSYLEQVGSGELWKDERLQEMDLPEEMMCGSEEEVIRWAFCKEDGSMKDFNDIKNTVILTPHNDTSMELNEKVGSKSSTRKIFQILDMVKGKEMIYDSIDTPTETTGFRNLSTEFYNRVHTLF